MLKQAVAPKDVWMPDLTAICDVLLGKLVNLPCADPAWRADTLQGYSTCAECVDSCTPFVFGTFAAL